MYKLLLCWRYLRTRYIALASIISVMLGVATMIVVNSVMAGFTSEMQNRIRGIISDLVFEARSLEGMRDFEWHAEQIRKVAGDDIEATTPAVVTYAMLNFQYGGNWVTRQVQLIGIDERTQGSVSDFAKYLQCKANREQMSFQLREGVFDLHDHQAVGETPERTQMGEAGWPHRREVARVMEFQRKFQKERERTQNPPLPLGEGRGEGEAKKSPVLPQTTAQTASEGEGDHDSPLPATGNAAPDSPSRRPSPGGRGGPGAARVDPFAARRPAFAEHENLFDPAKEQHTGIVLGIAMASFRTVQGEDKFLVLPGDDVKLTFPTVGQPPKAVSDNFTVVDFYESKMAEYDSTFVFVPIRKLQELRGMIDPSTGVGLVNSIQIKLRPGADGNAVRDKLRRAFPETLYGVYTWRDKQGALLAAVQMETAILNVLLFLIIAVAGFGILAIFYMIVVEKTRDIGILKSLGAPGRGVMGIFLTYGLSLGLVGSGVGMVVGLLFVRYINQIADFLGWLTGRPLFNPEIYYFYKIPAIVFPATVTWIVVGALAIAVLASVLPARRAARLHPVEALRYE